MEQINPLQSTASKNKSKDIHLPSIDVSFGSNRILYGFLHHGPISLLTATQLWGIPHTRIRQALWNYRSQWRREVDTSSPYRHARGSHPLTYHHPFRGARSTIYFISVLLQCLEPINVQIVGDDTSALQSVLKADVWRDHLLAEEVRLNARLAELDATPPGETDARLEEMRDEVSGRLAEVHASLADMDAESGPARAAALLAGRLSIGFVGLFQDI